MQWLLKHGRSGSARVDSLAQSDILMGGARGPRIVIPIDSSIVSGIALELAAMDLVTVLTAICVTVVGYVLLSIVRAIFFPPKPPAPLEYKPRQVGTLELHGALVSSLAWVLASSLCNKH